MTVKIYSDIVQLFEKKKTYLPGVRTQNSHTLPLSLKNLLKSVTTCLVYFNIYMIRVTLATCSDGFNFIDGSKN